MDGTSISKSMLLFADNVIKRSGPGLLIANWAYSLISLKYVPEKIPIKFNLKGNVLSEATKYIVVAACLLGTAGFWDFIKKTRSQGLGLTTAYSILSKKQPNLRKIALSYQRFNGFFLELIIFVWNLFVLNSYKMNDEARSLWIKRALITLTLIAIVGYTRYWFLLDKYFLNH